MTKRKVLALVAILLACASPSAAFMVTVTADKVLIGSGGEFVPRCNTAFGALVVPAGQTVELLDGTYPCVEISGTLKISRTRDTTAKITTLMILPGGYYDEGSPADPVLRKVIITGRDIPIDLAKDPYQWGNGFLNFGRQTRVGQAKTDFVEAVGSVAQGATSFTAAIAPSNWAVGDELLPDDTTQPTAVPGASGQFEARQESKVTIKSINGNIIELSKPLDFPHPTIVDPLNPGVVLQRPAFANLTHNLVFLSENLQGTPWHIANVGHGATFIIQYNENRVGGRTKAIPLDDFNPATGLSGTNQRGRYPCDHVHHGESAPGSSYSWNSCIGAGVGGGKWGMTIHTASDLVFTHNVGTGFPGAALVTEDGYEVRNVITDNFLVFNSGHLKNEDVKPADENVRRNCPGCEGDAIWARGVKNFFDRNRANNNGNTGIKLFNQQQPANLYPSVPGGPSDTALKHATDVPYSFTGNITSANGKTGFELWGNPDFPYRDHIAVLNMYNQVFPANSDDMFLHLVNPQLLGITINGNPGSVCVNSSDGYVSKLTIEGGRIAGCATGIHGGGGIQGMYLNGVTLQNETNIDKLPRFSDFTNVMHLPFKTSPHRYVLMNNIQEWDCVTDPPPGLGLDVWLPATGSKYTVRNWQGTGQDMLLFYRTLQLGSRCSPYSTSNTGVHNTPVKGLSVAESWDQYNLAFGGDMVRDAEALTLDGVIGGIGRAGLGFTLGPPRAVYTFPTDRKPAVVENGQIRLFIANTGNKTQASGKTCTAIDGQDPLCFDKATSDDRDFPTDRIQPGSHTVRSWRLALDGTSEFPGSATVGRYCVGSCSPPPVCVPPQILVNGVCVTPPPVCTPPQILVNGVCVNPPPPVCVPPQILVNGVCVNPTPPPSIFLMPNGTYEICRTDVTPRQCFTLIR